MATVYRDYGAMNGSNYPNNDFDIIPRTQVYRATHGGDEETNRLPFMNRSFISFSYSDVDGPLVYIEDFNLIATFSSDRWESDGYTQFTDLTTDYDNLDGQYYWGSHYKSHSITFNLATDGIDQRQLDNFLNWFRAGVSRELILSEHPNRAQMARVQEPPQLSLLPFKGETTMKISDVERKITTTLYKGEITLTLVMDEPHWYAKDNVLGTKITEMTAGGTRTRYVDWWMDANDRQVDIFASQDALKILYEDGIALGSMIENNMLLGNGAYANVENQTISLIWSKSETENNWRTEGEGARVEDEENPTRTMGIIAGAIVDVNGNGMPSLEPNTNGYFYYAGTAPSPTIISFVLQPDFNSNGYFTAINNSYTNASTPYNTIVIESEHIQNLKMTTPNLLTSYNKAVYILEERHDLSLEEMRKLIRDEIRHPAIRKWVSSLLSNDNINVGSDLTASNVATAMKNFFYNENTGTWSPITFSFNSKTGEAIGEFTYREPTAALSITGNVISSSRSVGAIEDVGDMLKSNGIYIVDRNHPNAYGKIVRRSTFGEGRAYSHSVSHNFSQTLTNFQIIYKNMYL